ncbi:TonB-dependent receptor [Pseudoxanthomonas sp.]|uniref:TonB-dependent receptor n=1 Tax=Pseudoxanthomonas sp. TaxID=1871049 RepID=UPI00262B707F|nr:TonB-dependent receptor [Pseudoxanthomonas sp.]WDS36183.1 MAG: TonB-dependent receptor [Pseudoxanthomonas sp.]
MSARHLLPVAIALALSATAAQTLAQEANTPATTDQVTSPTTLDSVKVTGQRAALDKALSVKQVDDHVVEVISADNMGQMPNVTVAEALARLPGVSATLDRGNASLATVRGLGPRMTMGTVNGREIASSEPDRAVRWEVFPTEIVSTVKVYKSPSADLIAGGIAATVDISTISPLDYTGPQFVGTAGPVFYDQGKDVDGYSPWGNRFGASWVHKINDDLAIAIGATYQKQKNANSLIGSWGYTDQATARDVDGDGDADATPWGAADQLKLVDQVRTGAMASLQWRRGNFELKADALYSRVRIDEDQMQSWFRNWDYSSGSWWNQYAQPGSSVHIIDNNVVGGRMVNSEWGTPLEMDQVIAKYDEVKTLTAGGLNGRWSGETWTIDTDLSASQAKRTNRWRSVQFGLNPDSISWDFAPGHAPWIAVSSSTPTWGISGSDEPQELRDRIAALAINASRQLDGVISRIEFGARASDRVKENRHWLANYSGFDQPISAYDGLYQAAEIPGLNVPPVYSGDVDAIAAVGFGGFAPSLLAEQMLDHWEVREKVQEAFAKAVFSSTWFGVDVTGNAGVRLVNTRTTSDGYDTQDGSTYAPSHASKHYTDVLPSATANFLLAEDKILRVSVAKVVARPPLDELRTGRFLDNPATVSGQLTGNGGNPQLDPFRATQLDLSYEWYFRKESMAALALYRKWVDSSIGYRTEHETINGNDYLISGPYNGGGGYINGVELTFQTPFWFIPGMENFGVYSNFSLVDSNLKEFAPSDNPLPLSGLARRTGNIDLWYSNGKLETRVGYSYHSPYTTVYGWNAASLVRLDSMGSWDASIGWQFNDHWSVKLQGSNLTNEPMRAYTDNRPYRLANMDDGGYQLYGRRIALDVTFKF